jgi:hypothetical protein
LSISSRDRLITIELSISSRDRLLIFARDRGLACLYDGFSDADGFGVALEVLGLEFGTLVGCDLVVLAPGSLKLVGIGDVPLKDLALSLVGSLGHGFPQFGFDTSWLGTVLGDGPVSLEMVRIGLATEVVGNESL